MPFTLMATFWFAPGAPGGTITYRWLRGDGYIGPSQSVTYNPGAVALTDPASLEWDVPAASADGTDKWAAIEVLSPNAVTSPHGTFQATCTYSVQGPHATVDGTNGSQSANYDCNAKGDQTFTFSGTVTINAGPGSHTVQYRWSRSTGATSGPLSAAVPPGATSVSVQPDSWVVHASDPMGQWTDQLVLDSPATVSTSQITIYKGCGP